LSRIGLDRRHRKRLICKRIFDRLIPTASTLEIPRKKATSRKRPKQMNQATMTPNEKTFGARVEKHERARYSNPNWKEV
jgi:hypothetical protein